MDDFFEVEDGGIEHAEDKVFVTELMSGAISAPDDTEDDDHAENDTAGNL